MSSSMTMPNNVLSLSVTGNMLRWDWQQLTMSPIVPVFRVYFDKIFFDDTVHLQKSKYGFIPLADCSPLARRMVYMLCGSNTFIVA